LRWRQRERESKRVVVGEDRAEGAVRRGAREGAGGCEESAKGRGKRFRCGRDKEKSPTRSGTVQKSEKQQ
jgi:hypothetical protein